MKYDLDFLATLPAFTRQVYGYNKDNKDNKPNDHCNWIEFISISGNPVSFWEENDIHFRERIKREYHVQN